MPRIGTARHRPANRKAAPHEGGSSARPSKRAGQFATPVTGGNRNPVLYGANATAARTRGCPAAFSASNPPIYDRRHLTAAPRRLRRASRRARRRRRRPDSIRAARCALLPPPREDIWRIDLPSDTCEISARDCQMARSSEKLGQQQQRPRELQRFRGFALFRYSAKPRFHRIHVAPRARNLLSRGKEAAIVVGRSRAPHRVIVTGSWTKKRGPPFRGPLGRVDPPQLYPSSMSQASSPASGFPKEKLRGYFFFFFQAFFFMLVFSLGLDFVAELLFFVTGIDTSLQYAAGQALENPASRAAMASLSGLNYRNPLFKNQAERASFIKKF